MFDLREVAQELLIRSESRRSIYTFLDGLRESDDCPSDLKYKPAAHHRLLIDDFHRMVAGHIHQVAISMPPGSAKSTYSSVVLPIFLLAMDPTIKILCISNSITVAETFSRVRRSVMKTPYWERISGTKLSADAQSLEFCGTDAGGGIRCAGAGATITGFRCDWLICDDLVKGFEQASSLQQLDKVWAWYLSEARSRLKPNGREVMLATRWAAQDPIGRVVELTESGAEDWKYIRIPMIADSMDDPLGRSVGDRLWPEWFTEKMVREAQRDAVFWNCLYQQTPLDDEGSWVEASKFSTVRDYPKSVKYIYGIDLALSVKKGDYTVIAVCAVDSDKHIYVVDVYRDRVSPDESVAALLRLVDQYPPAMALIDDDPAAKVWSRLVWQAMKAKGVAVPLRMVPTRNKDKETRNAPLRAFLMQGAISFVCAPWNSVIFDELSKFPGGRHDDSVDAIGLVVREHAKIPAPAGALTRRESIPVGTSYGTLEDLFADRERGSKWRTA